MLHWALLTTDSSLLESFLLLFLPQFEPVSLRLAVFSSRNIYSFKVLSHLDTLPLSFAFMHTYLPTCSLPHVT